MERELKEMERESVTTIEGDGEEGGISKLPEEMKEMIFAKLPYESICSSLTVCKEWNCILSSQDFLSSLPTQSPWLLICGQQENGNWKCVAYCFPTRKWRELSLSFLPDSQLFVFNLHDTEMEDSLPVFSLRDLLSPGRDLSSAGQGLLLFRETSRQLNVCNPLLRSYVKIKVDLTDKFVHIVQGRNKEPYLVVCSNSEKFSFEIYHYLQDAWRSKFQFAGEKRPGIVGNEIVECNGLLFWRGITPATIIGYKIEDEGFISPVRVAPLPLQMVHDLQLYNLSLFQDEDLHVFDMVSYESSLLVVGTFQEEPSAVNIPPVAGNHHYQFYNDSPTFFHDLIKQMGIVIWELFHDEEDELVWKWKEFGRSPPLSLPQYFDEMFYSPFKCICVGDYLCFSGLFPIESPMVFAFNLKEGFWQRLPPPPQLVTWAKMMSFEPNFNYQLFQK
ncbi:hypothetical protein SUGI_0522660 [Cryptomeria japonica]|nr:hypothetical protein SUGI_0522660 [Cryptomeria japonica]